MKNNTVKNQIIDTKNTFDKFEIVDQLERIESIAIGLASLNQAIFDAMQYAPNSKDPYLEGINLMTDLLLKHSNDISMLKNQVDIDE